MNAIELHDVTKTFGTQTAVAPLTLNVPEGTIYGFIGPNGSGKTTTIRMIMNILVPDSGRISVLGQPPQSAIRDQIGYLHGVVADVINVIWAIQFDEPGTRNMRPQETASLDADGRVLGSMQHQCRN